MQAYKEFENSITLQKKPIKDIRFIIFRYDFADHTLTIKQSVFIRNRVKLVTISTKKNVNIYAQGYPELTNFFKDRVAKTSLEANEEHKHLLINWGHGAGLGFVKEDIGQKLAVLLEGKLNDAVARQRFANGIWRLNQLTSSLSLHGNLISTLQNELINKYLPSNLTGNKKNVLITEIKKLFRVISATEFAGILETGLAQDVSVCIGQGTLLPGRKIQVMLCLTCYTNMIETTYPLKDIVNVYIAPQTEIPFYGYNYEELFNLLHLTPGVDEETICKNLTHFYLPKFLKPAIRSQVQGSMIHGINYREEVSFSAVYLVYCERIARKIGSFREFIEKEKSVNPARLSKALKKARSKCLTVALGGAKDVGIIDYENFMVEVLQCYEPRQDLKFTGFFSRDQLISTYSPAKFCRTSYKYPHAIFVSMSPGVFSIFLPDPRISSIEELLLELYFSPWSAPMKEFLTLSKWDTIIKMF